MKFGKVISIFGLGCLISCGSPKNIQLKENSKITNQEQPGKAKKFILVEKSVYEVFQEAIRGLNATKHVTFTHFGEKVFAEVDHAGEVILEKLKKDKRFLATVYSYLQGDLHSREFFVADVLMKSIQENNPDLIGEYMLRNYLNPQSDPRLPETLLLNSIKPNEQSMLDAIRQLETLQNQTEQAKEWERYNQIGRYIFNLRMMKLEARTDEINR